VSGMTDSVNDGLILRADKTIDCSGMLCPFPVVAAAKGIKQIAVGQVLCLIATDPGSPPDMAAWARQTGHTLLDSRQENGRFLFHFQRTK